MIVGAAADILAIIRLRPAATRASSLIDFGLVAVTMTLLLAALIGAVAALADARGSSPRYPATGSATGRAAGSTACAACAGCSGVSGPRRYWQNSATKASGANHTT